MKTKQNLYGTLVAALVAGALMSTATGLRAQEEPGRPDAPPASDARDNAGKAPEMRQVHRMMREMAELERAGKHDQAQEMGRKIRQIARNHPQVAEALKRAMDKRGPEAKKERPERSNRRTDKAPERAPERAVQPARMKMQKLRQAAELLQSAGYEEQAAKARAEIGRIEGNVRREEAAERSLKTDKVRGTQARPERPGNAAPVMEELRKIHRELDELRADVRRMKAQAGPRPAPDRRPETRPMDAPR